MGFGVGHKYDAVNNKILVGERQEWLLPNAPVKDKQAILLNLEPDLKAAIKRIAAVRHTSMASTAVWLLTRGADWFEGLSREQREAI